MKKCDKCEAQARYTMEGYLAAMYLCANCAANICESVGDTAGAAKFKGAAA